jgi:hypothetical protein
VPTGSTSEIALSARKIASRRGQAIPGVKPMKIAITSSRLIVKSQ